MYEEKARGRGSVRDYPMSIRTESGSAYEKRQPVGKRTGRKRSSREKIKSGTGIGTRIETRTAYEQKSEIRIGIGIEIEK